MHRVAVAARAGGDDGGLRRSLEHIWSDHLREQDGDHVHVDSACIGNEDSLQRQGATEQPDNVLPLFGRHRGEIDRRTRAGWMSFKRYKRELLDRPKASLLPLKGRMMKSEVVETLLYGCAS